MKPTIPYAVRRAILIVFAVALFVAIPCFLPTGEGKLIVADVTQACKQRVFAPLIFSRNGNLSVIVNGDIDGNATLRIVSNHGRDVRVKTLSEHALGEIVREYEAWVGDVVVLFEPGTARNGHLEILIACGK